MGASRAGFALFDPLSTSFGTKHWVTEVNLKNRNRTEHGLVDSKVGGSHSIYLRSVSEESRDTWVVREMDDTEEPDAMQLSSWRKALVPYLGMTAALPLIFALSYTVVQTRIIIQHHSTPTSWDWKSLIGFLMIGMDLFVFFAGTIPVAIVNLRTWGARHRQRLQLVGDHVPAVDVIITSCNEDVEIIQDTMLAVLSMDYPEAKFRVILADDGASAELESWVAGLGRPNVHYTSRSLRVGFKAGNLNHAVKEASKLPGGPHELIAALDADMIPVKRWLRSTVAHIILDDRMGLVCPTQQFYNVPFNDPLGQSNVHSWYGLERLRDYSNFAWNTGSGWVLRRQALLNIGGFPTNCLTEDVQTSVNMMAKGWKTAYLPEALQYGLIPNSYYGHLKQFLRWNIGGCQLISHFRFYLDPRRTGQLTVAQRIMGLAYGGGPMFVPILMTINQICTPVRLILGTPLAYFYNPYQLHLLLRLQCAVIVSKWVHDLHFSILVGYRAAVQDANFAVWMAPYFTVSIIRTFFLPSWLGGRSPGFTPTGTISTTLHERSASKRGTFWQRLQHGLFETSLWFHLASILAVAIGVAVRSHIVVQQLQPQHIWDVASFTELLRQVAWPSPAWLKSSLDNLTPLIYMMFPPDVPERSKLFGNRNKAGVRYPLQASKELKSSLWSFDYLLFHTILVGYSVALLFWSYNL